MSWIKRSGVIRLRARWRVLWRSWGRWSALRWTRRRESRRRSLRSAGFPMTNPEMIQVPRSMWRFLWLFAVIGFAAMLAGDIVAV